MSCYDQVRTPRCSARFVEVMTFTTTNARKGNDMKFVETINEMWDRNEKYANLLGIMTGKNPDLMPRFAKDENNAPDLGDPLAIVQEELNRYEVEHFTAQEICTPHQTDKAESLGLRYLIPPESVLTRLVALAKWLDTPRKLIGEPLEIVNAYRPVPYNSLVASSGPDSDHPHACAIDVYCYTMERFRELLAFCDVQYSAVVNFDMSLGVYPSDLRIHIGFFSPKGHRRW